MMIHPETEILLASTKPASASTPEFERFTLAQEDCGLNYFNLFVFDDISGSEPKTVLKIPS